jgi:flagellin-specific chaperone FliS
MIRELLQANLKADASKLPAVQVPLREIRDGWAEMIAALITPASVGNAPIKAYL